MLVKIKLHKMILSNKKVFFSIIIVAILGIAMQIMTQSSYIALNNGIKNFINDCNYADVTVRTFDGQASDVNLIKQIDGVDNVVIQESSDCNCKIKDNIVTIRCFTYESKDELFVYESKQNPKYINIALDYGYAKSHGIKAGDTIDVITMYGPQKICVGEIVSTPECQCVIRNGFTFFDFEKFCYAYIPKEISKKFDNISKNVYFRIYTKENVDAKKIKENVIDKLSNRNIIQSYTMEESPVEININAKVSPMKIFSIIFPILFIFVVFSFIILFMDNMVQKSRAEIGLLRALGFQTGEIQTVYLFFVFSAIFIASIIGVFLGYLGMKYICYLYMDVMALPDIESQIDISTTLISILLVNIVGQLGAIISVRKIAKIQPGEVLKGRLPSESYVSVIEKKFKTDKLFFIKMGVIGAMKNKKRFMVGIIFTTVSMILLVMSFEFVNSKNHLINNIFNERYNYSEVICFYNNINDEMKKQITDGRNIEIESGENLIGNAIYKDKEVEVLINGIEKDSTMINIYDNNKEKLQVQDEGIILCDNIAKKLDCIKGDYININGYQVIVTDISNQDANYIQYCSIRQAKILGTQNHVAICRINGEDKNAFENRVSKINGYLYYVSLEDQEYATKSNYGVYNIGASIVIGFTLLMCITVIYNLSLAIYVQRIREFSILKVLGCTNTQILISTLVESAMQLIVAIVIGGPLGYYMVDKMLMSIGTDSICYPVPNSLWVYAVSILIIIILILLGHFSAMKNLNRIDISVKIKDQD